MLVIILGNLGSGKTYIMMLLAYQDKRQILSNFNIKRKNVKVIDVPDLLDLPDDIVLLMDEAYSWIESRSSLDSLNKYLSSVLFHIRKTNTDIYITTPMYSTIDKRFRNQANYIIFCKHRNNFESDDFHFLFYDVNNRTYGISTLKYSEAKKYFHLYDTNEKVESYKKRGLQFNILKKYPERMKEYIKQISKLANKQLNGNITHDRVKKFLFDNGIDLGFHSFLYIDLKGN